MAELKIGVNLPTSEQIKSLGGAGVAEVARRAEAVELDSVAAPDVLTGEGAFSLEATVTLATAAGVTKRPYLDFGVLGLPTRPAAMLAAQIQTLQYLSGGRVRLGVGIGGFPGSPFWRAVGAPEKGRGTVADEVLKVLPGLVAGAAVRLESVPGQPTVTLAPGTTVPPFLIAGSDADAPLHRVVKYGDAWLPSAMTTKELAAGGAKLRALAERHGRAAPAIHLGIHAVLGDDTESRTAMLTELSESFGISAAKAEQIAITGEPGQAAERMAAYAEAGAAELLIAVDGQDYLRQIDLIAEARALLRG